MSDSLQHCDQSDFVCPEAERHGKPFRYCPVPGCGWIESTPESERSKQRRSRLLADLAVEGASRCCYMPGAGNPEAWPKSRCDCKYVRVWLTGFPPTCEETGCCEVRGVYRIVEESLR